MFDLKTSKAKLSTSAGSVKEGNILITTVETKNVNPGTTLFWTLRGQGIDANDLWEGELTGSGTVSQNGTFSFSHFFAEDLSTEGDEKLLISLFADKSLTNKVAETAVALLDSSTGTIEKPTYALTTSAASIQEGGTVNTVVDTKNVTAGTTLFWTLTGQGIDADDVKKGELSGSGTVLQDGSFSFSHLFSEDLSTEGTEKAVISLFSDKSLKNTLTETSVDILDSSKNPIAIRTGPDIESHVIPARFSGERIPVNKLINFSKPTGGTKFTFNNSSTGGYFEYRNEIYQGKELRDISIGQLDKVFYVPKAPAGNYDASKLRVVETKLPTETLRPKGGRTNPKGNTELVSKESLTTIRRRQDPFNPLVSLNKRVNPSIVDQISVSTNTGQGTDQQGKAQWITRGNWKPEIAALQQKFSATKQNDQGIPLTEILDIHDLDGDEIKQIEIEDLSGKKNTGHFQYGKKIYQGTALPALSESELSRVTYHPGEGSINRIQVSARDALNGKSNLFEVDLITKDPPKTYLSNSKQAFDSADIGRSIPISNLINISTAEAIDSNTYSLKLSSKGKDGKTLGYFSLNNQRLKPEQLNGLSQKMVRDIEFIPTSSKAQATFTIEATNLLGKTTSSSARWQTNRDKKPRVDVATMRLGSSQAGQPISISNLINAADDSGAIKSYTFKSMDKEGSFQYKGKTYSNKTLVVAAKDLDLVKYITPKPGKTDRIKVTATDGNQESQPFFTNWGTLSSQKGNLGALSQTFDLGINKEWKVGDFLGVDNERSYSEFFGMDKTIGNVNLNRDIVVAGVKFKTGNTRMKSGLQLDAGYGLGSLTLQGGLSATATLDKNGLSFAGTSSDPTLDLELPYAYLNLDAVGKFKFSPSLKLWYDVLFSSGETQNILGFLNTDVDISNPLIDLDTRDITGNNYTRSFRIGAFSAEASIPRFGNVSELNYIPPAILNSSGWSDGFGDGVAYGIQGSQTLLDLDLSLGQVASYFGLPLSINKSIWGGDLSVTGTLADATIGIDADLNYAAKVAVKPNVYAKVEGLNPNKKYDILGTESSINPGIFSDTNNDGKISVTIEADPIISANASVSIEGNLNAAAEVLSASATLNKWGRNKNWNVGPLWDWGPQTLYSDTEYLVDLTKSYALSDLAPNLQDRLSVTLDLPVA